MNIRSNKRYSIFLLLCVLGCNKNSDNHRRAEVPAAHSQTPFDKKEIEGTLYEKGLSPKFVSLLNQLGNNEFRSLTDEQRNDIALGVLERFKERSATKSLLRNCHFFGLQFENKQCEDERQKCWDKMNEMIGDKSDAEIKAEFEKHDPEVLERLQTALRDSGLKAPQLLNWLDLVQNAEAPLLALDCNTPVDQKRAAFENLKQHRESLPYAAELEKFDKALLGGGQQPPQ